MVINNNLKIFQNNLIKFLNFQRNHRFFIIISYHYKKTNKKINKSKIKKKN